MTLTDNDVQAVISRSVGSEWKVLDYKLEPFNKHKDGCLGDHQLLVVRIAFSDKEVKYQTYFVKTEPQSLLIQEFIMDDSVFPEEVHYNNIIHPMMMKNYTGEKWSPICYLTKDDLLVYEDLRAQGYVLRQSSLLDESSLKLALTALARFHAASFDLESRLGRRLCEVFPKALIEKQYTRSSKFGRITLMGFDTISHMAERFGMDSTLVPMIYELAFQKINSKEGNCHVICHGDLWKNNLLFNDSKNECILVDFQFLRYASLAIDLAMLIYIHTTQETRKKWEFGLIKHYYSSLKESITQLSNQNIKLPKYEDVLKEYCEHRLIGMIYATTYVPGTSLDPEDLAEIMSNPEVLQRYFFKDRIEFFVKGMKKNIAYENLLRTNVGELLQEASRVFS